MPSCHAVRAKKALYFAALRVRFLLGKGFIPIPSKTAFYCVTNPQQRSDEEMAVFRVERNKGYTERFSILIRLCYGHSFVLCFDFLNLSCRGGDYSQSLIAHIIKQTVKLSALRGFVCYLVWKKELVYRYI